MSTDDARGGAEPPTDAEPLLQCTDLSAGYGTAPDVVSAVGLRLDPGSRVGIVGESGCGKSTLLRAVLGTTNDGLSVRSGTVRYRGVDITRLPWRQRRRLLGPELAMVAQHPSASLDPVVRVGSQLTESVRVHTPRATRAACRAAAAALLRRLRFEHPESVLQAYPHQLSGGMAQRAAIAMALLSEPRVLLADEPTSALDGQSRSEVVDLLDETTADLGTAVLLVSHQLALVRRLVSHVHVLADGTVVESGSVEQVLPHPSHPSTRRLTSRSTSMVPDLRRGAPVA